MTEGYSAKVRLDLQIDGVHYRVAQVGGDVLILKEQPSESLVGKLGIVTVTIDGSEFSQKRRIVEQSETCLTMENE